MQIRKRSAAALVVLAAGLAGGQAADTDLAAKVDRRVETWQIKPEERPFDAIGWARDIRHARRLAAEHQRPVFLFTLDGRMDVGRC